MSICYLTLDGPPGIYYMYIYAFNIIRRQRIYINRKYNNKMNNGNIIFI